MSQLNIHMTPKFEQNLKKFMRIRHINTKAEAIRIAIGESLQRSACKATESDFSSWIGLAVRTPINENPKFSSDDDLWK